MDSCLSYWNTETGDEFPQRKPFGVDKELVELLWQNGEVVLHSQNNRKQRNDDDSRSKQALRHDPNNLIEDVDTASWIDCPIDESFEKEFCSNFLSEVPPFDPVESSKQPGKSEKVGASDVNHVGSSSKRQDFGPPPPLPPPRFQASGASRQIPQGECSIRTIGSSHCASNQVDMSWGSSCGIGSRNISAGGDETCGNKVREGVEREGPEQARTSCSGGSGSSFWKTNSQSNDSSGHKRKSRDAEEYECPSDANELESASGNKGSQKSGTARRSRVAEVHNMSERRRRDRINEKMKALQELIPHSNKSDKASMLDEAIEYMKSLQLQIQLMWMGRGMAPLMLPGMQQYMSRIGMGIGPPMLPAIQNLMRLSRLPLVDQPITMAPTTNLTPAGQVNYQHQMQNSSFQQQYANFMGFPNTSQPTNMFNFGFHSPQQNEVSAPRGNGNGSVG